MLPKARGFKLQPPATALVNIKRTSIAETVVYKIHIKESSYYTSNRNCVDCPVDDIFVALLVCETFIINVVT
jgi:hypothetical protein